MDRHGVLEMRRARAVGRRDRPAVVREPDVGAADGDHRLDRDRHPLGELGAAAGLAEVRDVRVLVVVPADAMTDEALDDREAGLLDDGLDRVRDVADPVPEPCFRDPGRERGLARVEEAL